MGEQEIAVFDLVRHGPVPPLSIWLNAERYEWLPDCNRRVHELLVEKGYNVVYREYNGVTTARCGEMSSIPGSSSGLELCQAPLEPARNGDKMQTSTITAVEIYKLNIARQTQFRIAIGVFDTVQNILVPIHASDGRYGLGEGAPLPFLCGETQAIAFEASKEFAGLLIGRDPYALETRMQELGSYLVHNTTARSAFDMALYDLLAKRAGLPLYALWGVKSACSIPMRLFASTRPRRWRRKRWTRKSAGLPLSRSSWAPAGPVTWPASRPFGMPSARIRCCASTPTRAGIR